MADEHSPASILATIFEGSDLAHGKSTVTTEIGPKGKVETKCWTVPRPATLKEYEAHYSGQQGLGLPPIRSDSKVRWGAIDVDIYGGIDLEQFARDLFKVFPQLVLCRSKSGGPHIFLFTEDWVDAKSMVRKLEEIAAYLGFGTSEIFPKQVSVSTDGEVTDYGNWINLPYFDGSSSLRFAYDSEGKPILDLPDFQAVVSERKSALPSIEVPITAPRNDSQDATPDGQEAAAVGPFHDGPPCLTRIWQEGVTENRNVSLSNCAVYLKKAFPTNWQQKLDEYNQLMSEPLGSEEVEAIKKSYAKKDYRYQCSKEPLCRYCFARVCRERPYGVGGDGLAANNRSLSKFDSDPPVWFLDVDLPDGSVRRMSLTTEQLQRFTLFQRRVMEELHQCPSIVKQEFWISTVQSWMKHVSVIEVPPETTPKGAFLDHLADYLRNRSSEESPEDLLRKLPYRDLTGYFIVWRYFLEYLDHARFKDMKAGEMMAIMKDLGAEPVQKRIQKRPVRLWKIPLAFIDKDLEDFKDKHGTSPF